MELLFGKQDIKDAIRYYYKKYRGADVTVSYNPSSKNVDEVYKVIYSENQEIGKSETPVSAYEISNILRTLLTYAGLVVEAININYGGMNKDDGGGYVPHLHKITIECKFKEEFEKKLDSARTI